ncbi:hypothetical protein L914_17755 [Phytophthora nicotianae]|uniref:Uncharacterized protein n=1 Tax=Phytophthora nicotianae TaxID=4792 RepID=W2MIM0_PHYNI|nr:hypothetical protein L914_17755 [Phytophthora nicotianae]
MGTSTGSSATACSLSEMRLRQTEECAKRSTGAASAFVTPCTSTTVLVMTA